MMLGFNMIEMLRTYRAHYDCDLDEAYKYLEKDLKDTLERVRGRIKSMEKTRKERHNLPG